LPPSHTAEVNPASRRNPPARTRPPRSSTRRILPVSDIEASTDIEFPPTDPAHREERHVLNVGAAPVPPSRDSAASLGDQCRQRPDEPGPGTSHRSDQKNRDRAGTIVAKGTLDAGGTAGKRDDRLLTVAGATPRCPLRTTTKSAREGSCFLARSSADAPLGSPARC
jgi:hypothetical protein